jgi:hypothetical protein
LLLRVGEGAGGEREGEVKAGLVVVGREVVVKVVGGLEEVVEREVVVKVMEDLVLLVEGWVEGAVVVEREVVVKVVEGLEEAVVKVVVVKVAEGLVEVVEREVVVKVVEGLVGVGVTGRGWGEGEAVVQEHLLRFGPAHRETE